MKAFTKIKEVLSRFVENLFIRSMNTFFSPLKYYRRDGKLFHL